MEAIYQKPKIAIVGYGRHGKDFVGEIISKITYLEYGGSTSWAALPYVAKELGIHPQTAWETRHENRKFWYEYCNYLRRDNPCFLIEKVLEEGHMAVGIRDKVELVAMQERNLVSSTVWIDAAPRIATVDPTVTFTKEDCSMVLSNAGTKESLYLKVYCMCEALGLPLIMNNFTDSQKILEEPCRNTFAA